MIDSIMRSEMMIEKVEAFEVFDSRGHPTVEAVVHLRCGAIASAISPSGASVGSMEALELRDGQRRLSGKGVLIAVDNVNNIIAPALLKLDASRQAMIDKIMIELDGTDNKSKLGANAILAVSMAVAKAASVALGISLYRYLGGIATNILPVPLINMINGGAHADNALDIQEFMIMPIGKSSFKESLDVACEIFYSLKSILLERRLSVNVGDEGGFAPQLESTTEALDLLMSAIEKSKYEPGKDALIAMDVAANEIYVNGRYNFNDLGLEMNTDEVIDYYRTLIEKYPIFSIEDPLAESDDVGFAKMTNELGHKVQIVGDDLFVTNPNIIADGINNHLANAVLIKPNQIGTLTETMNAIDLTLNSGYAAIASHRSGETEDVTISHLAVSRGMKQIKVGSLSRTDRIAKYNELLRIERHLGTDAIYAGDDIFRNFRNFKMQSNDV